MTFSLRAALTIAALIGGLASATAQDLRTAVDGTFAPHAMPKLSGGIEGFNVDLAEAIGAKLGRKITVDAAQFSGLLPALQAGPTISSSRPSPQPRNGRTACCSPRA